MTVRTILRMGDVRLLQFAEAVSCFDSGDLRTLIRDMFDTMHAANGVGLAAPQIGVNLRIVIFEVGLPKNVDGFTNESRSGNQHPRYPDCEAIPATVLINPVITSLNEDCDDGWEGCLSLPGLRGSVARLRDIRYQGYDERGEALDRIVSGFHARVVQHECDHLDGILYPSRMRDMKKFGFTDELFPGQGLRDE